MWHEKLKVDHFQHDKYEHLQVGDSFALSACMCGVCHKFTFQVRRLSNGMEWSDERQIQPYLWT